MVRSTRFFNINLFLETYLRSNHISRSQSKQGSKFKVSKGLLSSMHVACACLAYNLRVEVFFAILFFFFWDFFSNFVVEVWKCLRQILGVWFLKGISRKYTLHDSIGHESYFSLFPYLFCFLIFVWLYRDIIWMHVNNMEYLVI